MVICKNPHCGKEFTPKKGELYCSHDCRREFDRERQRAYYHRTKVLKEPTPPKEIKPEVTLTQEQIDEGFHVCENPECRKVFKKRNNKHVQKYCCDYCKDRVKSIKNKEKIKMMRENGIPLPKSYVYKPVVVMNWSVSVDPWTHGLRAYGLAGLPVPMSTSVNPWWLS